MANDPHTRPNGRQVRLDDGPGYQGHLFVPLRPSPRAHGRGAVDERAAAISRHACEGRVYVDMAIVCAPVITFRETIGILAHACTGYRMDQIEETG